MSLVVAFMAAIVGLSAAPAQADHSWGTYHWKRTGAVQVKVYDSVTTDWNNALSVANSDWNKSAYLENTVVASDDSSRTRRRCNAISGAVRVCNYAYGNNGWAGIASISLSGGHISQGTAKMNDTYLGGAGSAKRQGVMCQEVGHDWGLGHQDENFTNPNLGTCMDYTNDWSTNQHPNQHDYDQLTSIYSHSDAASAAGESGVTTIRTGGTVTMITWA
ncbi:MAG: hypothetical protein ACRDT4_04190 [Micromonosporaceae bacterium]